MGHDILRGAQAMGQGAPSIPMDPHRISMAVSIAAIAFNSFFIPMDPWIKTEALQDHQGSSTESW